MKTVNARVMVRLLVGLVLIEGILNRDFPIVQGAILVIAGIFVLTNIVVDVLYAVVNPKIRCGA